jgi:hypothetical protein
LVDRRIFITRRLPDSGATFGIGHCFVEPGSQCRDVGRLGVEGLRAAAHDVEGLGFQATA